jgi:hypothetical protein
MRSATVWVFGLIALGSFAPLAIAAPPAAPVVTVGADIKQLQFDWDSVATSTRYELWFKASDEANWTKYTEIPGTRAPRFRIGVSVHLLDWRVAKYRVAACNPSGCTNSAPVGVSGLADDAVGYFKPQTSASQHFGTAVAISADGQTFAVSNGETMGSVKNSATVYVYRKTTSTAYAGGWRREARLLPSTIRAYTDGSTKLSLSADGNVLALAVPDERITASGDTAGAVYLFRRTGSTWQLEQRLRADPGYLDFGFLVDLDDAGQRLIVGSSLQDKGDIRIVAVGFMNIFEHGDGGWQRTQVVPPDNAGRCRALSLSGDGQTLARHCIAQDIYSDTDPHVRIYRVNAGIATLQTEFPTPGAESGEGIDLDYSGTKLAVRLAAARVEVWQATSDAWSKDGTFPIAPDAVDVAISRDGKFVVASGLDDVAGHGIVYPPISHGAAMSTSVYVYQHFGKNWGLRRVLKPEVGEVNSNVNGTALGDHGRILVIGTPSDASAATGLGGDPKNTSAPARGAAWLY